MRLIIQPDYESVAQWTADYIVKKILTANPTAGNPFVLGLPTGSSPVGVYRHLIEANQMGVISFEHVITFNMDEYVGLPRDHKQSFFSFMWDVLFKHIDIKPENVNILNGNSRNLVDECEEYEKKIKSLGGIDLFLGGVGEDGHIAFNEPGSSLSSRTRVKTLTTDTIRANARFFDNEIATVPHQALTVGVGTVMDAHEVIIIASGHNKARAIRHAVEEPISHQWTISALQLHPKAVLVIDEEACDELRVSTYRYFSDIEKDNLIIIGK